MAISRRARLASSGGESAASGTDFEDRALRDISQGFHNAGGGAGIHQKVLAQFGSAVDAFPRPRFLSR